MMKNKKLVWLLVSALAVSAMILASCGGTATTTEPTSAAPTSAAPTSAAPTSAAPTSAAPTSAAPTAASNWWDELGTPEYGGSITIRVTQDGGSFDSSGFPMTLVNYGWYETMLQYNWSTPRTDYPFKTSWCPPSFCEGNLLASWEWKDPTTLVGKVQEGVKWQNKAPSNGRAFTAYDIQDHYDRLFGLVEGIPANTFTQGWIPAIKGAKAIDDATVEIYFYNPTPLVNMWSLIEQAMPNRIDNTDVFKAGTGDWQNVCGTGPYILTEYVHNSYAKMVKNTDYWQKDSRFPENTLPYADEFNVLVINDSSTSVAALRTGKLDALTAVDWQQAQAITKSSPELATAQIPASGYSVEVRVDHAPFTDINVRKALQMAIDYKQIANGYYGGLVNTKPNGLIAREYTGYSIPFDQWPAELQAEYTFNVDGAKKLLEAAGLPNGFDMEVLASTALGGDSDTTLLQIVQSMWKDIGVNMTINAMEAATYMQYTTAGKHKDAAMTSQNSLPQPPSISLKQYHSKNTTNLTHNNSAEYDALYDKFNTSATDAEAMANYQAANMLYLQQHWCIQLPARVTYTISQPYLKGYDGENITGMGAYYWYSHFWVDSKAKTALGR